MQNDTLQQNIRPHQDRTAQVECTLDFIETVWNRQEFDQMPRFLADGFVDYSLPFAPVQNQAGLRKYLQHISRSIYHHTRVLELNTCGDLLICQVMIEITAHDRPETVEKTEGYRIFKMVSNKIAAHWEIL